MTEYGFRSGSFRGLTVEESAAELVRLGYRQIEICLESPDVRPETLSPERCREIRQTLAGLGITIASASYHGDNEEYGARAASQELAVRVAAWLGAPILVLNAERSTDQARQWTEHVVRLKKLAKLGREYGVTLAIEPEPLLVIGSSRDMQAMIDEVGSPWLKVNLDVGHAEVTDPSLADSIRLLGASIVHLHLEDIKAKAHKHLAFGAGDIDFAALRTALAEIGYVGPYVADMFGFTETPAEAATKALAGMRARFD